MGQPYTQFGNIRYTCGWSLDYQGGVAPSVCTIRTVPHLDHLEQHGDLIIGEEGRGELVIRDCLLLSPTLGENRKWDLPILDRRWKWAYGTIDGVYNIKRPDKTLIREKTPRELAELLLKAMGETKWDISRLPNFARPEVDWTDQTPAAMLDDLVTSLGCVLALDYFSDKVVIWPNGQGNDLPDGETISRSLGLPGIAKPDKIICRSKRTLFQARFATEAVAKDTDGKIKKIADLQGYRLTDCDDPEEWSDIDGEYDDHGETKKKRDLAKEWGYRAYRVTGLCEGGWAPGPLLSNEELAPKSFFDLEFIDSRAEQEIDENDTGPDGVATGRKVNKKPLVVARWYNSETDETPAAGSLVQYHGHVTFEPKLGLVRFADPVYLLDDTKTPTHQPATVYVDIGFYAGRDGVFHRSDAEVKTGEQNNTGPRVIVRGDVEPRYIQRYENTTPTTAEYQPSDVGTQLGYYANGLLAEYTQPPSLTRTYRGLYPIVPDGKVRQVTWSGGDGQPAKTQASQNTQHNPYLPTIDETRRKIAIEEILKIPPWQRTPNDRKLLTAQFG